jgi:formylglycine-generating enzyme required for sulfatase activity
MKRISIGRLAVVLAAAILPGVLMAAEDAPMTFRDCPECPEMVVVPAGSFMMGSPEAEPGRDGNEGPQHEVKVAAAFAIGKYPITFAEWDACAAAGGCTTTKTPLDRGWGRGKRPVMNVTWGRDVQEYLRWLSKKTGMQYRLPSEAEWEYAARAGTASARYWGEDIEKNNAVCTECGSEWDGRMTAPVGRFAANPFGLYDMLGNVWQWVEDCFHLNYAGAPTDGTPWLTPTLPGGQCQFGVARGGSWNYPPGSIRAAARSWTPRDNPDTSIGFRIARNLSARELVQSSRSLPKGKKRNQE